VEEVIMSKKNKVEEKNEKIEVPDPSWVDSCPRYACTALEELRNCVKTLSFGHMAGLIEELQTMFNRMEAGLHEYKDLGKLHKDIKKYKKIRNKLHKKCKKLAKKQ
jgi:hypothetical protein